MNDKDFNDHTLLHSAVIENNLEITKFLVSHGANIKAKDMNRLSSAFHYIYNEIIMLFISHGL
ncbi:hypothetical protein TVAG_147180 [Trichomonas vaginalis G3]|uniref:Uncharacterized protein n=1 Tax=Trichomonas vaginalis (strain ATCC PRA-98 / G3) TaxID=412133 RepID=A2DL20_TRIV3|nr:Ankyrin repeat family [Trichomonas vaginalis G3]EAY18973.1 hypothetical protein TVAG_147180 [Trichomonas vaginalis G3]KAI5532040.1 Ankyrin repeat family [Trichomonas vaginalis G3]|eukprot:XP_001579959.1 hypothetical protein [Trichomonas vaginalis G3]